MKQKYDTQTLFILREFKKALDLGAHRYAVRIVIANPQIPVSQFMDAESRSIITRRGTTRRRTRIEC